MGERRCLEKEIEIRALTGESTTVSISPNKTVQDLKLLLKHSFPPASSSPNFHLFLKGVKLSLQSQINSQLDGCGDFIVLVPFTKRVPPQAHKPDEIAKASEDSNQCSTSKLAESAFSDMMQDLSSMKDFPSNENNQPYVNLESTSPKHTKNDNRRKSDDGVNVEVQDLLLNMLQSCGAGKLDEKSCKRFSQVLESVSCLSDPQSGSCMLWEANCLLNESSFCLCQPWLRRIVKAFYFLNIYSGFLQLQREKLTLSSLEGVLYQLAEFGVEVGNADIEHLSVLCPQIVYFAKNETERNKLRNALVIIKCLVDRTDEVKASRRIPISKIIDAMRKRERTFKIDLWKAVKSMMDEFEKGRAKCFSLEDLLLSVSQRSCVATKYEAKRANRSWSEPSRSYSSEPRCNETTPLLPMEMVEHLRQGFGARGQIVHLEDIKGRDGNYVEVSNELSENTRSALKSFGVTRLYSHQAESIQGTLAGKNVIVATMTSSGKSLCYNIPVLEVLSQNLLACALYLFPTKALAQDQLRSLQSLSKGFNVDFNIGIYDGDTPTEDRMWLRDNTRLLITNPDMLHISVLPFHGQFRRILSNLRFIIIDEAHVYKGAFGCHSALILRRLRRLCAHVYGSDPSFIFCTATSANPREHAMELAGLPTIELIQNDGSPSGPKLFALWNPPLCLKTGVAKRSKSTTGTGKFAHKISVTGRSSPILEVSCLFAEMVQHGLRCIAFCKTRKLCELVLCYTREILQETAPHLVNSICGYRGGYVAQDRRRIESDFFGGNLLGVAATNALELGIDVGHIDATLHLGFPGSLSSLWQQAGRSGRREKSSLAVYVAFEGPLDQYFMKSPQKLFRGPVECCHVDAKNQQVLEQHLVCAALEHPLSLFYDEKYFGPGLKNSVMILKNSGFLSTDPSRDPSAEMWSYIGPEKTPSHNVSIRAIENERYKVIDMLRNEVLEEIEESKAFFQVYEGAVYMHQGKTYLVKNLDVSSKIAFCQVADLKYYTRTRDCTDVHVIGSNIAYQARIDTQYSRTSAQTNMCNVTTTWFGFWRIRKGSNQVIDTEELSLPSFSYKSQAVWIRVPDSVKLAVEANMYSFRGGLHAACHALLNVVPLYIICSASDLASECVNPYDTRYVPERILLYDSHPGGTGISAQVKPLFTELLIAALELLTSCSCSGDAGCPNCVQSLACQEYNEVLHKDAAVMIIKGVLDAEKSSVGEHSSPS